LSAARVRIFALLAIFGGAVGYDALSGVELKPLPFRNCAAARAAGPTPITPEHPRWGDHLDAGGDGRGCEPLPKTDSARTS
jgi:hypothetical protein